MTLSDFGSVASIIALTLTIWVAIGVRRIRMQFLITARMPELSKRMRQHATNLSEFLNEPNRFRNQIHAELAAAEVTVHSLQKKLSWHSRRVVKTLLLNLRSHSRDSINDKHLRDLYVQMVGVNEQLRDMQKDLKWER